MYYCSTIEKAISGKRITAVEALLLFKNASLGELGYIANSITQTKTQNNVSFIFNIHIEPSNICIYGCRFCAFSTSDPSTGWQLTIDEIIEKVSCLDENIQEVHIVGGSNENCDINYYTTLFQLIKKMKRNIHIKALTASEISFLSKLSGFTIKKTLEILKQSGLDSIPGGGAEIFNKSIRKKICPNKISGDKWLKIHETAHKLDIPSNATMLYGHFESVENRIEHLIKLRELQDKTMMFNCFVPLKFKIFKQELDEVQNYNSEITEETNIIEDLKMFAISRILLDNFKYIKTYLPAFGEETSLLSLSFGANDIEGILDPNTKIYASKNYNKNSVSNRDKIISFIKSAEKNPVQRDSGYGEVKRKKVKGM